MVNYRRHYVKGGTFFFTVNLRNRKSTLLVNKIDLLRYSMHKVKKENPYAIKAIVILPDHIHAILVLPEGDDDYSLRWRKIKRYFTIELINAGIKPSKNRHGEYSVWQRRFWEHTIRDDKDLEAHVNYIHYNPVKHGYVKRVTDWPYSSFHRYVKQGILNIDWAGEKDNFAIGEMGE